MHADRTVGAQRRAGRDADVRVADESKLQPARQRGEDQHALEFAERFADAHFRAAAEGKIGELRRGRSRPAFGNESVGIGEMSADCGR